MKRAAIWRDTLLMTALYAAAILGADRVLETRAPYRPLALALAFALVQVAAIVVMLAALFVRKGLEVRRASGSAAVMTEIQQALAIEASGQDQLRRLRSLAGRSRRDVERAVVDFHAALRGDAADRIRAVATALGIAIPDEDERIERLFARAASGNLLERAIATEQLEANAALVAERQIARALTASDLSRVTAALDMLAAWRRVLPARNIDPLLRHEDAAVRARAFRALPYVEHAAEHARAVVAALRDPDGGVRIAAAEAAARLQIDDASTPLARNLDDADRDVVVAAAFALAWLPSGQAILQRSVASGTAAAPVALEAIEKSALQRLELA